MKNLAWRLILGVVVLSAAFYLGFLYAGPPFSCAPCSKIEQPPVASKVSLMIDRGDGTVKVVRDLSWHEGQTVFETLKNATDQAGIKLEYKDYGGEMGVFVQAIDEQKNGKDKWWQYWQNNIYGEKGASTSLVQAGDVIEWKLVKGQLVP